MKYILALAVLSLVSCNLNTVQVERDGLYYPQTDTYKTVQHNGQYTPLKIITTF